MAGVLWLRTGGKQQVAATTRHIAGSVLRLCLCAALLCFCADRVYAQETSEKKEKTDMSFLEDMIAEDTEDFPVDEAEEDVAGLVFDPETGEYMDSVTDAGNSASGENIADIRKDNETSSKDGKKDVIPEEKSYTNAELFASVRKNPLFKDISKKYSEFNDKQIFILLGECVRLPEHLQRCTPFSCTQLETPDLESNRKREIIGSYDDKCYYREISDREGSPTVECELSLPQQKQLADEISEDLLRLTKTDVLQENTVRPEAESVYTSCVSFDQAGEPAKLIATKKEREAEINRIRQAYADKLNNLPTEEEKDEAIAAIDAYQKTLDQRLTLKSDILDGMIEKRTPPALTAIHSELWKLFPAPPQATPEDVEEILTEEQELAAYLANLDKAEANLPPGLRLPPSLRQAAQRLQTELRRQRSDRISPSAVMLEYPDKDSLLSDFSTIDEPLEGDPDEFGLEEEKTFVLKVRSAGKKNASATENNMSNKQGESLQIRMFEAFEALIQGQYSASITLYKALEKDYADHVDVLFGIASAYHKSGQYRQARPYYERAIAIEPDRQDLMNNFLALLGKESPVNALLELQKLEKISPGFSPIPAQIGFIHFETGNYDEAAKALRRAVSIDEGNPQYLYNLAVTMDKLSRREEATYYYRKYLRSTIGEAPSVNASRDDIQRRISQLEIR